jgi:radical SAM superfamily enzyme YgiQ (UPF0313 family)
MKVTLIKPKYPSVHESGQLSNKINLWSYFSSLVVVSSLFPDTCDVEYYDEDFEPIDFTRETDYVFITSLTYSSVRAYEIAAYYRNIKVPVIMGGIHASLMPEETSQYVDTLVIGEAEPVFDELFRDMQSGQLKKVYKSTDFIMPEKIAGLDRRLIIRKDYLKSKNVTQLVRGCPHGCTFCTVTKFFGNKFRFRPLDQVMDEIKFQLSLNNNRMVSFLDDNIFSDRKKAKEFLKELIPLKILWWSQGTLNVADDEEVLQLMKESGCVCIFVGIEDISQKGLKELNKNCNIISKYHEQIEKLHSKDIMVMAGFIFGLETHDESVFQEVVDFIQEHKIELPFFSILTPYPGTEMYNSLLDEGRILSKDWSLYNHSNVVYQPKNMSVQALQEGFNYVIKETYSISKINERLKGLSPRIKMLLSPFMH